MLRFFSRILMITTFFIGLGAITDTFLQFTNPTKEACSFSSELNEPRQIKFIKLEKIEGLPNVKFDKPLEEKKILVFRNF